MISIQNISAGHTVRVVNPGSTYTNHEIMAALLHTTNWQKNMSPDANEVGRVIAIGAHEDGEHFIALVRLSFGREFLIGIEGLERVEAAEKTGPVTHLIVSTATNEYEAIHGTKEYVHWIRHLVKHPNLSYRIFHVQTIRQEET